MTLPRDDIKVNESLTVSIITVCFNAEKHIEKTIKSVLVQTYPRTEYIIVDGASTDNTLTILSKYSSKIKKIISEKDAGVYDAMNKGIKFATGDIVYFLNSDDRLFDNATLSDIVQEFSHAPSTQILCGKVSLTNIPKQFVIKNLPAFDSELKNKFDILQHGICHQRIFTRKEVFNKIGNFNKELKVYGDLNWLLTAFNKNIEIKYIDRYVAFFNIQGMSYQMRNQTALEKIKVIFSINSPLEFIQYVFYCVLKCFKKNKHENI
ncbi:MAG: hypothetical protein A2787_00210 [Omnitrophica WOR_2 bacterium RIFCSPHIGHO2_01_FULL_48_9]|nr:MAG: hypothetical protein A2787_00210 [Omnitrophica WOR_2 bacterium RIFCSPHIGHO2_01_FULL_48_9]